MATSFEETSTPPSAFYCPISLELMTDPVTLSSGISYDRSSIQSWFASGHLTCPVTRQPLLPYPFFTPNHTLLRIIRTWCHSHSLCAESVVISNSPSSAILQAGKIRIGKQCTHALFKLGLVNSTVAELIPHEEATPLLISLISHYGDVDACQVDAFAQCTCNEALATLSILPLSSHHLTGLSHPLILPCLSHFLFSTHRHSRINSAFLLTNLVSRHPSRRHFLENLSLESLSALTRGLAQILKQSNPSKFLAQDILHSLCLLCKSSRTALLSLTDATTATLVHVALEQLLHSARQGATPMSEKALSLLGVLAGCAEGRDAIASHASAVCTIARFLERSISEAAIGAAVVVLWKMCRYSSRDRVRHQAMEACVPSKLVLLMQASHLGSRGKKKAGALVRLLIEEAESTP